MKTFIIAENDAAQRLDKFIGKAVPLLPKSLMYKYIRTKRIKINNKRSEISTRLQTGDKVDMYINDEFFEERKNNYDFLRAGKKIDIIFEDENIIILDKRAGLLCHPDNEEYTDTLIGRVQRYLYEKGEYEPDKENSFTPALANRIDRNTGGIVICAKNAESLRILNQKIKDRELKKLYLCIVAGILPVKEQTIKAYLRKDESKNKVIIKDEPFEGAKTILTKYKVLEESKKFSLIEVDLLTGRTHQIRAQFAHISHPLLGDGKYGSNKINRPTGYKRQALYSYKLKFIFTSDAGILSYLDGREFEAENVWIKDDFKKLD